MKRFDRAACLFGLAGVLLGPGCNAGTDGAPGDLLRVEVLEPGFGCADGGLALMVGADADRDGVLDDEEVTSTEYVCDGLDGESGHSTLIEAAEEPPGENCAAGGALVATGTDLDDDGVLDDEEVVASVYVCHGADGDGASSLVAVQEASPGEGCEFGGMAIRSGVDANADGLLQPEEVDSTELVCNGGPGADGADGARSLVRQEDASAGECPFGGRVVMTGLDEDADGYLDDDEVESASAVCNGEPGAPGHASLFEVFEETAGACAAGGYLIATGLDTDDDGALDPPEVTATSSLCHGLAGEDGVDGEDGARSLVAVAEVAPGGSCGAVGGVTVQSGLDLDGDGALEAGEVTSARTLCDGADGAAGRETLVAVAAEPPGAHCPAGGERVDTGMDDDRDGVLDAGEVSSTSYVCDGGGVVVRATSAAWGGVCARGGVRLESGVDDDRDGVLDDAEVDHAHYVCNLFLAQVEAGENHTCAAVSDGTARCWGRNDYGQLGDGTTTSRSAPVTVSGLTGAAQVSAGGAHTCARLTDGTARCWGNNGQGQLGDGTTTDRTSPVTVSGLAGVAEIAAGFGHTCARLTAGAVRCWGQNQYGQLGDGTTTYRTSPVAVSDLAPVADLSAGGLHTCARLADGTARCWGRDQYGQLGDGATTDRSTPVTVTVGGVALSGVAEISAGYEHTCTRQTDGTAKCWGSNYNGQLGDGTTTDRASPVTVSGLTGAAEIAAGFYHTCARLSDGAVRCWGSNAYGQLGDGSTTQRSAPVVVGGLAGVAEISTGGSHTVARLAHGDARASGFNGYGQLGDGSTTQRTTPVPVASGLAP